MTTPKPTMKRQNGAVVLLLVLLLPAPLLPSPPTDEAKLVLKESYLQLRQRSAADTAGLPITHRTLEGLARLAAGRAGRGHGG